MGKPSQMTEDDIEKVREYVRMLVLDRNAASARPLRLCQDCRYPLSEVDTLFKRRCPSCGALRLEKILRKVRRRFGRKRTIELLENLIRRPGQ